VLSLRLVLRLGLLLGLELVSKKGVGKQYRRVPSQKKNTEVVTLVLALALWLGLRLWSTAIRSYALCKYM